MSGCMTCNDGFFLFCFVLFWSTSYSVFNVTDQDGSKLPNREVIYHIQKVSMLHLLLISDVSTRHLKQLAKILCLPRR
jgi:hypothetical protein